MIKKALPNHTKGNALKFAAFLPISYSLTSHLNINLGIHIIMQWYHHMS